VHDPVGHEHARELLRGRAHIQILAGGIDRADRDPIHQRALAAERGIIALAASTQIAQISRIHYTPHTALPGLRPRIM
jgi:hypothetical protein